MTMVHTSLTFLVCLLATRISGQDITTEATTSGDMIAEATTSGDITVTTQNGEATKAAEMVDSTGAPSGVITDPQTSGRSANVNPDPNNVTGDRIPRPNMIGGRYPFPPVDPYYSGYPYRPPYYFKNQPRPDWGDEYPFQTVNGDGGPPRQWTNGNEPTGSRPRPSGGDGRIPPPWANGNEASGSIPRPTGVDGPNIGNDADDDLPPPPQPGVTYKKVCYYYPVVDGPAPPTYRPYDRPSYPNRRYGGPGK